MSHDDFRPSDLVSDELAPSGATVIPLRREAPAEESEPFDVADDDTIAVPVDPPNSHRPTWNERTRGEERRQILPSWLRSREALREQVRWVFEHYRHVFAFHTVRTPMYAATLVLRSPVGAARAVGGAFRWVTDADSRPVRAAAVRREDADEYLKLERHRDGRVKLRGTILAAAMLAVVALVAALVLVGATWALVLTLAVVLGGLGFIGAPQDRPIVGPAVIKPQVQKLTSEIIIRALGAMGNAEINKALAKGGKGITFPAPITRDGPGWRADIDLPYGVTAVDIMERRDRLASGLRRPMGCVWPEPVTEEHAGRMVLWVGDQPMNQVKQPAWPLAKSGTASLFQPIPFATDQRGRTIPVTLMFANVLIGAMPRFGKTFALRLLVLAAALDVLSEMLVYELKGTGDLSCAEQVAADYASGPDDETIERCVKGLRYVYGELDRRAKVIRGLPKEVCPENKVTPALAAKKSLRLHPLVVVVDECQELFSHPEFGKEAETLCTGIIKRGPALGVMLLLATQRPDKDSMPTGVSANVGIRFCLRVMGQLENDMVLGTSSYKNGLRATTFTANDKGIGYLVGHSTDAQISRTFYVDNPGADRIAQRARALRAAAGTLTGYAAGQSTETESGPTYDLLADILAVVPPSEPKVWNELVVDRLAELRPEVYGPWATLDTKAKPAQLTTALKPHGVAVGQVWGTADDGKGANRRGIARDDIATAVTKRDSKADRT